MSGDAGDTEEQETEQEPSAVSAPARGAGQRPPPSRHGRGDR